MSSRPPRPIIPCRLVPLVRRLRLTLVALLLAAFGAASSLRAQSISDLGELGTNPNYASGSIPTAINDVGQVVGYSNVNPSVDPNDDVHAFLYSNGTMTDLGTLDGGNSYATGINDEGQISGYANVPGTNPNVPFNNAFVDYNGTMTDIGTLAQGSYSSYGEGINNAGQMVGYTNNSANSNYLTGFVYSSGNIAISGTLPGDNYSYAFGINNSGQTTGLSSPASGGVTRAVLSTGALSVPVTVPADATYSTGKAVNDAGQVAGFYYLQGDNGLTVNAFLSSGGVVSTLGNFGGGNSEALGINDSGEVVGFSTTGSGNQDGFVYTSAGMQDLNVLYASLLVSQTPGQTGFTHLGEATAINSEGQIVGEGTYWNGSTPLYVAYLINPEQGSLTPTSQPTSVASGTSYTSVTPVTTTGGLGTTVSIVGGSASSDKTVTLATTTVGSLFTSLASDVVVISGNDGDIFAPQLTFNLAAANQVGGAAQMTLLYLNTATNQWENAVLADHGTNNASGGELDYQGSFSAFQAQYGTDLSDYLGAYGVDTTDDTVWAVIDHNSEFGTGNLSDLPITATPEPSTWAMLLGACGLIAFVSRRRATR